MYQAELYERKSYATIITRLSVTSNVNQCTSADFMPYFQEIFYTFFSLFEWGLQRLRTSDTLTVDQ